MTTPNEMIADWKRRAELNRSSTTQIDLRLADLVQTAYSRLFLMDDWDFRRQTATLTTTAGLATANGFPAAFHSSVPEAVVLRYSDGVELVYQDDADWNRRDRAAANGRPTHFHLAFSTTSDLWTMELYPTPDAAYTVYFPYRMGAETLSAAAAVPLPAPFVEAIEALFQLLAFRAYNAKGRFAQEIKDAMAEYAERARHLRADDRAVVGLDLPGDVYGDVNDLNLSLEV